MSCHFIDQVQILMQSHQIRYVENILQIKFKNYMWLSSKKEAVIWMSSKHEFLLRQALTKVTVDQQVKVMKQLLIWLDDYPDVHSVLIPEKALALLNLAATANIVKEVTLSRMASFRNSIRRMSEIMRPSLIRKDESKLRRSVTFNDVPIIYRLK